MRNTHRAVREDCTTEVCSSKSSDGLDQATGEADCVPSRIEQQRSSEHTPATLHRVPIDDTTTDQSATETVAYDPGPNEAVLSNRYGLEFDCAGEARKVSRLESEFGQAQVHRWAEEGMPVDAMAKPRDMQAFRARQDAQPSSTSNGGAATNQDSSNPEREGAAQPGPAEQTVATESIHSVVSSSGTSMDESVQREMESKMGGDFDDVQLHTGPDAAAAADSINARAFTVGNHVAFNRGEYDPDTSVGKKVLAHELAHVRQQTDGRVGMLPTDDSARRNEYGTGGDALVQSTLEVAAPDDPTEQEADEIADAVMEMENSFGPEADTLTQAGSNPTIGTAAAASRSPRQRCSPDTVHTFSIGAQEGEDGNAVGESDEFGFMGQTWGGEDEAAGDTDDPWYALDSFLKLQLGKESDARQEIERLQEKFDSGTAQPPNDADRWVKKDSTPQLIANIQADPMLLQLGKRYPLMDQRQIRLMPRKDFQIGATPFVGSFGISANFSASSALIAAAEPDFSGNSLGLSADLSFRAKAELVIELTGGAGIAYVMTLGVRGALSGGFQPNASTGVDATLQYDRSGFERAEIGLGNTRLETPFVAEAEIGPMVSVGPFQWSYDFELGSWKPFGDGLEWQNDLGTISFERGFENPEFNDDALELPDDLTPSLSPNAETRDSMDDFFEECRQSPDRQARDAIQALVENGNTDDIDPEYGARLANMMIQKRPVLSRDEMYSQAILATLEAAKTPIHARYWLVHMYAEGQGGHNLPRNGNDLYDWLSDLLEAPDRAEELGWEPTGDDDYLDWSEKQELLGPRDYPLSSEGEEALQVEPPADILEAHNRVADELDEPDVVHALEPDGAGASTVEPTDDPDTVVAPPTPGSDVSRVFQILDAGQPADLIPPGFRNPHGEPIVDHQLYHHYIQWYRTNPVQERTERSF